MSTISYGGLFHELRGFGVAYLYDHPNVDPDYAQEEIADFLFTVGIDHNRTEEWDTVTISECAWEAAAHAIHDYKAQQ